MATDAHGSESDVTEAVIGSAFEVANVLGAGFLEKVYERALVRELAFRGVSAKAQVSFPVCYKGFVTARAPDACTASRAPVYASIYPWPPRKAPTRSMMRSAVSLADVSTTPTVSCKVGRMVFPAVTQA
jgi:hypothetical protein